LFTKLFYSRHMSALVGPLSSKLAAMAQLILAGGVLLVIGFAPPARGEMLLIPLNGRPLSPHLLQRGALVPERAGPLPGSLLVFGSSDGQFMPLLGQGVLIVSAPMVV
jgi:hypothetical protein